MHQPEFFNLDVYSNHFLVTQYNPISERIVRAFIKGYVSTRLVRVGLRYETVPDRTYAAHCGVEREYRLHRNQWKPFVRHCENHGIDLKKVKITQHTPKRGAEVGIFENSGKTPHDYQLSILEYLKDTSKNSVKLVGIQTGKGKTFVAMKAIADEGRRSLIVLKPKYIAKWMGDIEAITNATSDDIIEVRGSTALMGLLERAASGRLTEKVIVISNRTMANYISFYEEHGDKILDMGYSCCPQDICELLQVDTRLIDEVHEDFHFNFKLDLYTHIHRCISLSATLTSENYFQESMYELAYPLESRSVSMEYDKYAHSIAYHYNIENGQRIRTIGSQGYSHHLFEDYILSKPRLLIQYFDMIKEIYDESFIKPFQNGDRCLLFCTSIDMCTALTMYLQQKYPDVVINRFVQFDPYENLIESRTAVTTVQSGGTGHDITGLTTVIMTAAISSRKSNIQGFGRLRKIEGRLLRFIYLVCNDVQKQVEYHIEKEKILIERTLSHKNVNSNKLLRLK